jgi:hypothetical protein
MSRYMPVITRDTIAADNHEKHPSWFSDFIEKIEIEAAKSKQDDYAMFEQINSILGNKSKYSTVEEAVEDMKNRTGLSQYLQQIKSAGEVKDLFVEIPSLKLYIDNYIKDRPGTSVDAVVHDLLRITMIRNALPEGDDVPESVKRYINDKIAESKREHGHSAGEDMQLGKLDLSIDQNTSRDNNPFSGCEPNRDGIK